MPDPRHLIGDAATGSDRHTGGTKTDQQSATGDRHLRSIGASGMLTTVWRRRVVDVREGARKILEDSWRPDGEFCPPNARVYPHQWLWDSCFHSIAWAALGDARGTQELTSCFRAQLPSGFVPHMRYLEPNTVRGPLNDRSSYTQPPIYAHAARVLADAGLPVGADVLAAIERGLEWLWEHRMSEDGLLFIVHPWESGADDSPRWDSWIPLSRYDHRAYSKYDADLVTATEFAEDGAAIWSQAFVAVPAAFNAFAAHAASELSALGSDPKWQSRAHDLAAAMDEHLWDDDAGLWMDAAVVGGGETVTVPTLDGAYGALASNDEERAHRVLSQLIGVRRFGASYGLRYLPPDHPAYEADEYWRGPAWPQLNYMAWIAARRWDRSDVADAIAAMSVQGAAVSQFAEYWNAETGAGHGAEPQGWAALAAVYPRK